MSEPKSLWFVVTPQGKMSEPSASFRAELTRLKYMSQWLPNDVKLDGWSGDALWLKFKAAGYEVRSIALPDDLEHSDICNT